MVEKTVALLAEMKSQGAQDYWCISFDHASIRQVRALDPDMPLGYLYEPTEQMFVYPDDAVQAYCPYYRTALAHPDQVQQALSMGKNVFVYTVDSEEDVHSLVAIGVVGMVTDTPAALLRSNTLG
jgi:glycerophosphoryl diester phosphodiesterase